MYTAQKALLRNPATDAYKLICGMSVQIENGLRIPLDDILEEEMRARLKRVGWKEDKIQTKRRATKLRLSRSALELAGYGAKNPE